MERIVQSVFQEEIAVGVSILQDECIRSALEGGEGTNGASD